MQIAQEYSAITIERLTRSSEIVDQTSGVPDVVAAVTVPTWGSTYA